ncbi:MULTISPECIES: FecCD family ABC transporter permease [Streptomyces]|uniref:Putative siderophore transport system integral membrane component, FecCD family n=1 Tax=Streptomyces scabiei (strain 87.22) TaxID=680198 RepID=C9Z1L0_STRSW|nr:MULTISPECIES: iron chelate uptake ABC transporter family permease subunit [Streptomyces]KFG04222.1 iron ABC transporter permease [Streptomyces scabiei]MBP5895849.1 iron chelate uptake ABC transporter family permease subunit [Streptomyces sp. LBUM 1481]MBP5911382.1 iron chelate uptake ABC transporter family permease subunit [Streptomyces sp. LBUM 1486]MBP5926159.1 iron chelate uptake ABC transporter family permease subunit [Streptomyces sp. LBUM 1483]MDX2652741.1 iron chelate uptake ABC tran
MGTSSVRAAKGPRAALLLTLSGAALLTLCTLSMAFGALGVPLDQVWHTLLGDAPDARVDTVIWSVRLPRTALGLATGAALGLSGALMQALTRNPLADPGILGVSAGAAFAVVLSVGALGISSLYGYIWFAFGGAFAASVLVYLLGGLGRSGSTPVKLALAGVAVTSLLFSLTSAIALTDPDALNRYRFWSAGSLADQDEGVLLRVLPFLAVGALLALACAPALNSLALGDDVAKSLGLKLGLVRVQGVVAVTLLTGGAVAVIGPVVFVGLVVPHIARVLAQLAGIGPDHRWLLPLSAVLAPCLLLAADIAGRLIARPTEIQAGILVAFLGGPFFIALVRRRRLAEL